MHAINPIAPAAVALVAGAVLASCSDRSLPAAPVARPTTPAVSAARSSDDREPSNDVARAPVFTAIDFPGAVATVPLSIGDDGTIVGRVVKPAGQTHGFLRSPSGEFTIIDFPGASFSVATARNARGDVVGQYSLPGDPKDTRHGYVSRNGVFTTIDVPGAAFANALGINGRGDVVGRFCTRAPCVGTLGSGNEQGYVLHDGVFEIISVPGARETDPFKFGREGEIVGVYLGADGNSHFFVRRGDNFATIDVPGANAFAFENGGINRRGDIVGTYCDIEPCVPAPTGTHGFLLRDDELSRIDYPGAGATGAFAINARGDIVGYYFGATGKARGFLLTSGDADQRRQEE